MDFSNKYQAANKLLSSKNVKTDVGQKEDSGEKNADGQWKLPENTICQHVNIPKVYQNQIQTHIFTLTYEEIGTCHLPLLSHTEVCQHSAGKNLTA